MAAAKTQVAAWVSDALLVRLLVEAIENIAIVIAITQDVL